MTDEPNLVPHVKHDIGNFPFPVGTRVVTLVDVLAQNGRILHPRGAVGVVVNAPADVQHAYRVRFPDAVEVSFKSRELTTLAKFQSGTIGVASALLTRNDLFQRVIYQCVIGSQAYGLSDENSDVDRRGIYLPPADLQWSLYGTPEQLECHETQEAYWELQKFLNLALKANPNVLECLYSPLVEHVTPLAQELLDQRSLFLSRLVFQTYNGYVMSQFKKMHADIRNQGQAKWKHVMHLIRLLLSGIHVLREGVVPVRVDERFRDRLLSIKRGEMPWTETETLRKALHVEFEQALNQTALPERPDYAAANDFLIRARRAALNSELP